MKIGDKVKIISKQTYNLLKDPVTGNYKDFVDSMSEYCGKEATITSVIVGKERRYRLDIDNGIWTWASYMFSVDEEKRDCSNNFLKDLKTYCTKICILPCSNECPLFKYKNKMDTKL